MSIWPLRRLGRTVPAHAGPGSIHAYHGRDFYCGMRDDCSAGAAGEQWAAAFTAPSPQYEPPPPGCSLWTGGGLDPAAEAWLHDSLGSQCQQHALKATIPRILHHIYLPDKSTFLIKSQDSRSATNPLWSESCLRLHPQWQHVFWGEKEAVAFLEKVD